MSTSVCHGLQSRFEPWPVEPPILRLKLAQPTPTPHPPPQKNSKETQTEDNDNTCINTQREYSGGWNFLQALTNTLSSSSSDGDEKDQKGAGYVHPMARRSVSILSEKSLEMCTESLGSETGSTIVENDVEFPFPCFRSYNGSSSSSHHYQQLRSPDYGVVRLQHPRASRSSFPPPLTTMSNGVQVMKENREHGRLVIKAVSVEDPRACFKAERTDGRLLLHFIEDDFDEEEEEGIDEELEYPEIEEGAAEEEEEEQIIEDEDGVGGGRGVERLHTRRSSRCNEGVAGSGNREMVVWEQHFWVASS
ncbi:hypothetical protein Dimus_015810 [Dionaea muscipula]